ncbi:hypothetical protein [Streptomyces lomondensis]|uniref:Membrane protein n=1 Tax=Streptomyces lomondensis TaxID=68229 RepID=A0ABQ2X0Z4_9ACTN|nr:hypothetical protein [Streptomyces lomondensis]MCF0075873.1 hypothetical protein [Streptomyces lomondensis]GGW90356.1 membrane protein [Streptomyces lomondensis]
MSGPSSSAPLWATYALTTGTLSVGLDSAGYGVLSRIAVVLACAAWLGAIAHAVRRAAWRAETATALTFVAATAVVGTGLSAAGRQRSAAALLALAALLWTPLLASGVPRRHGTVFLRCVATQGLAVLGATLAAAESAAWLAHAALTLFWLGLVLYCLALFRFEPRQVGEGAGDHWLAGGALAVSALAGAKLLSADSERLYLWNDDDHAVLSRVTVALLVLTAICCVALFTAELFWPRRRYDVRRWATVFAAVVTATAALAVAAALDAPWLDGLGEALLWLAVAAWLGCTAWTVASARAGERPGRVRSRARR